MPQRTTVRLDEALLAEAKARAALEKRTLTSVIEEGLRLALSKSTHRRRPKRITLPVSPCSGGTLPGVDLSRSADLLDVLEGRL